MQKANIVSPSIGSPKSGWVSLLAIPFLTLTLMGCGQSKDIGTVGYIQGFGGIVSGSEPRAVLTAGEVLSAGGNVADAAVALYFTMSVTYPSLAGLGAGGVCIMHNKEKNKTEVLNFLPASGSKATLPGAVRGFYALHAREGQLRWESLIIGAERMARQGSLVSRAFAKHLEQYGERLNPQGQKIFFRDGKPLQEGDTLTQHDLATSLSLVRRNPGGFYSGANANAILDAAAKAGTALDKKSLHNFIPKYGNGYTVEIGYDTAYFAQDPAMASLDVPTASFAILDNIGNSLACVLTLNDWFGSGKFLPYKGFALAATYENTPRLGAVLVTNQHSAESHMVAATNDGNTAQKLLEITKTVTNDVQHRLDGVADRVNGLFCQEGTPDIETCRSITDHQGHGLSTVIGQN